MRLTTISLILAVTSAQLSLQARTPGSSRQDLAKKASELFPKNASLLHIITNRPCNMRLGTGKHFKEAFARHPEVRRLNDLSTDEEKLKHIIELRKHVDGTQAAVKNRFRRAIDDHMVDIGASESLRENVMARITQINRLQTDRVYKAKKKSEDPRAWSQKHIAYNTAKEIKNKERKATYGKTSPFEERLKQFHLSSDASAVEIERAARNIVIENSQYTTSLLKKYLSERFEWDDIDTALANRTHHLDSMSKQKDRDLHKERRMEYQKKYRQQKKLNLSAAMAASGSPARQREDSAWSSSHANASQSVHLNIDPMGSQFHPAPWWDEMYRD